MWAVCYWAPHCPMGENKDRRFILVAPLYHPDPWGEIAKAKADAEPDPWWVKAMEYGSYAVILACMIYPTMGVVVLGLIAMGMAYMFIQKITETGRFAPKQEGEQ